VLRSPTLAPLTLVNLDNISFANATTFVSSIGTCTDDFKQQPELNTQATNTGRQAHFLPSVHPVL
jgi:hypothetical protein